MKFFDIKNIINKSQKIITSIQQSTMFISCVCWAFRPHRLGSESCNYIDFGTMGNYYFKKLKIKNNAKFIQRGKNDFLNKNAKIYILFTMIMN